MRNHSAIRFATMLAMLAAAGMLAIACGQGGGPTSSESGGVSSQPSRSSNRSQEQLPARNNDTPASNGTSQSANTSPAATSASQSRVDRGAPASAAATPAPAMERATQDSLTSAATGVPAPATMAQAGSAQGAGSPQQGPAIPPESGGTENPNDGAFPLVYFEHYGVNPFIDADEDPLSTFALDGDTASYEILKLFLNNGHLAEPDSVRVEEYINSLPQNYAPTETALGLHLDAGPAPFGNDEYVLLRVGVSNPAPTDDRDPVSLIFVVDVSGSMEADNRLGLAKEVIEGIADRDDSQRPGCHSHLRQWRARGS